MSSENPHEKLSNEQIGLQALQVQRRLGLDTGNLDNYNRKQSAEAALKEINDLLIQVVELKRAETEKVDLKVRAELFEQVKGEFKKNNVDLLFMQPADSQPIAFVDKWVVYLAPQNDVATWPNLELALVHLAAVTLLVKEKTRAYREQRQFVPADAIKQLTSESSGVASTFTIIKEAISHILKNYDQF